MTRWSNRVVLGLVGYQFADAAFNAVALYDIAHGTRWGDWAKDWARDDLDHLRFPEQFRFLFPIIKSSSAAGLLVGLRWRRLGRLTAGALVTYFVAALGFHLRARDPLPKFGPAAAMLLWSCVVLRSLSVGAPET